MPSLFEASPSGASMNRIRKGPFKQDAEAHLHTNLLASCVNTPIDDNVFHNLHACVARCSASCGPKTQVYTKKQVR